MHIALVTPSYLPVPGGGERYVAALARELAGAGQRISVVTSMATREADFWQGRRSGSWADDGEQSGITIWRTPLQPMPGGRRGLLLWRKAMVVTSAMPGDQVGRLSKMASRVPHLTEFDQTLAALEDVDLVHAFNVSWEGAMVAAHRYATARNVPLVVTPFAHFGSGPHDRVALNSTMAHQMRIMADAAEVMVLTAAEELGLVARGLPPERIRVIGGGLDESSIHPELPAPVSIGGQVIPPDFLLFLGRASFDKGAIHAAEAIRDLRRAGRDVTVVLAGSPTDEFDHYFGNLRADERSGIVPLGIVSEHEKQQLLAHATLLLLPSRSESLGLTLLEAWAYGRPVIGANAGSIPHVVSDGYDGLLVPFGDVTALANAITHIADNPELAAEMGRRGRAKVDAEYGWASVAERVLSGYRAIVRGELNSESGDG